MVLDWKSALPLHWIDRVEMAHYDHHHDLSTVDDELPEWADIDLPVNQPGSFGTRAVVENLLDHRNDYDYDEFDRQLGVVLLNEAYYILESTQAADAMNVDSEEIDKNHDQDRHQFMELVALVENRGFNVPTKGFEGMEMLNEDGFMTENYGSFGRKYASAVVNDISRERVTSGRVPVPDDLGIDFTKPADLPPEVTRTITQAYDVERMSQRSARLNESIRAELDAITGPIDENSELARSIDNARISERLTITESGVAVESDAEREFNSMENSSPFSTSESIEELLSEYDAIAERNEKRAAEREIDNPGF